VIAGQERLPDRDLICGIGAPLCASWFECCLRNHDAEVAVGARDRDVVFDDAVVSHSTEVGESQKF